MKSRWLAEFHRQWQAARGGRLKQNSVSFSRDWEKLLADANIQSAEDRRMAETEARALHEEGHIKLNLYRGRHLKRILLPTAKQIWLRQLFGTVAADAHRDQSLAVVDEILRISHPRFPAEWRRLCAQLKAAFAEGRNLRPFFWRKPDTFRPIFDLLHAITTHDWPSYTLVRDASIAIGLDSKGIERHQSVLEAAMTQLFQREMTLEALGIMSSNSEVSFHGPLILHFADGTQQSFDGHLHHQSAVTAADLDRAISVGTTAHLLFTVENRKTTFRHMIAANRQSGALVVTTSFPTKAVTLLLRKLPLSLPHQHFGDTDPAGYLILFKLRQLTARPISTFEMSWLDSESSPALSEYDLRVLALLLDSSQMGDCRDSLTRMLASGRRGRFEQEDRMVLPDFGRTA